MNIKCFLYSLILMMVLQTGIVAADVHHIIFDEQDNHSLIDPIADDSPDSIHMDTDQHQCGHSHCVHFVAVPHVVSLPLSLFKDTFFQSIPIHTCVGFCQLDVPPTESLILI
ncbi:MAG: hypothetical protein CMH22_02710 [Methylophaga sp.]|nr:hypothetical protein [Methylophaga sp.]